MGPGFDPFERGLDLAEVRGATLPGWCAGGDERDVADGFAKVVGMGEAQAAVRDSGSDFGFETGFVYGYAAGGERANAAAVNIHTEYLVARISEAAGGNGAHVSETYDAYFQVGLSPGGHTGQSLNLV